jgi:hypothetical protein
MKEENAMLKRKRMRGLITAFVAACAVSLWSGGAVAGGGGNNKHELLVYSIEQYGFLYDYCVGGIQPLDGWKHEIAMSTMRDPYDNFWDEMFTNCSTSECAYYAPYSKRRKNSEVTVNSMVSSGNTYWQGADMVFFFGHNTMIRPQWSNPDFELWRPYYSLEFPISPLVS